MGHPGLLKLLRGYRTPGLREVGIPPDPSSSLLTPPDPPHWVMVTYPRGDSVSCTGGPFPLTLSAPYKEGEEGGKLLSGPTGAGHRKQELQPQCLLTPCPATLGIDFEQTVTFPGLPAPEAEERNRKGVWEKLACWPPCWTAWHQAGTQRSGSVGGWGLMEATCAGVRFLVAPFHPSHRHR